MPTITDTENVYSTLYTKIDILTKREMQKTDTISAIPGKCISIENLSMKLQVSGAGVEGTAIVTAEADGNEEVLTAFTTRSIQYEILKNIVNFVVGEGKPVILRWYLKTTSSAIRSRMRDVAYTYSYVDPEPPVEPEQPEPEQPETPAEPEPEEPSVPVDPEPEPEVPVESEEPATIMIVCSSRTDAEDLAETLKQYVGDMPVSIWGQLV